MWSCTSPMVSFLADWILLGSALWLPQGEDWTSRLVNGEFERSGQALASLPAGTSFEDLGGDGVGLLRLDLPSTRLVLRGMASKGRERGPIVSFLNDLILAHRGNPLPLIPRIDGLLENTTYRTAVLPFLGRGALQLCRSGKQEGIDLLRKILSFYEGADWALSNLANGYRFVGQYGKAEQVFERLMKKYGRQAWFLNGLALVHQARFEYGLALSLYQEGGAERSLGAQADRFTCRTNAAILLIRRRMKGDLDRAEQLLELVVSKDPAAIRAPYYLRRIWRLRRTSLER